VSAPSLPRALPRPSDRVRVGTAGWSYPDWEGIVYPSPAPRDFDRLRWLASFLDIVEINATFYRPARPRDAASWVRRVAFNPRFRFTAKLDRVFTHEPGRATPAAERAFRDGIAPLAEAGLLAALLVQFPQSFHNTAVNRRHMARLLTRLGEYPLAVELRHRDWLTSDLLGYLSGRGIALVGIDQPQIGETVAPSLPLTASFFYVRLHGRNAADWFRADAGRDARYNYLYSEAELKPWVDRIGAAALAGHEGIVIANNHYRGQAAANAVEIRRSLGARPARAPDTLMTTYPRLRETATALSLPPGTGRLF
jgi:uncharacterized protein YecE (DUF72 family)